MRTKNKNIDFAAISKRSVKRDFKNNQELATNKETAIIEHESLLNSEFRIASVQESSSYNKYYRYIIGKLVRLIERSNMSANSWYCEFIYDDDRKALNKAAGWSDNKRKYLFDGVKFKK